MESRNGRDGGGRRSPRHRPEHAEDSDGERTAGAEGDDQERDEKRRVAGNPRGLGELDPADPDVANDLSERRPRRASSRSRAQWMQAPVATRPVRPRAGAIASRTDDGVRA